MKLATSSRRTSAPILVQHKPNQCNFSVGSRTRSLLWKFRRRGNGGSVGASRAVYKVSRDCECKAVGIGSGDAIALCGTTYRARISIKPYRVTSYEIV